MGKSNVGLCSMDPSLPLRKQGPPLSTTAPTQIVHLYRTLSIVELSHLFELETDTLMVSLSLPSFSLSSSHSACAPRPPPLPSKKTHSGVQRGPLTLFGSGRTSLRRPSERNENNRAEKVETAHKTKALKGRKTPTQRSARPAVLPPPLPALFRAARETKIHTFCAVYFHPEEETMACT